MPVPRIDQHGPVRVYLSGAAAVVALSMMGGMLHYLGRISETVGELKGQMLGIQRQVDTIDKRVEEHEQAIRTLKLGGKADW